MIRANRLTILFLLVFALALGILFATPSSVTAHAEINYVSTVEINNATNGYTYGNGEDFKEAESLQEIFDTVLENATSVARIRFNNVATEDKVELDYATKIVLEAGAVTYSGSINDDFITLKSGALEIAGAQINADMACAIKVKSGAKLTVLGGNITTSGNIEGKIQSTLHNEGECVVKGGIITYESSVSGNAGRAISQTGANSLLTITESGDFGPILIKGKSAIRLSDGIATINGGTIKATANDSPENGGALIVANNAKATLNGGVLQSVNKNRAVMLVGNGNSSLSFDGGSVEGNVLFGRGMGGNTTSLKVAEIKVVASEQGNVILYAENDEALTKDNAKLDLIGYNGYYLTGWVGIEKKNPAVSELNAGVTAVAKTSNLYEVSLVVDGVAYKKMLPYNYTITDYSEFGIVVKEGYAIKNWKDALGNTLTSSIVVKGEETYEAELVLERPSVISIKDVIKAYDGKEVRLEATDYVVEAEGLTYTYVWRGRKSVVNGATLALLKVADSDEFVLEVTVTNGVDTLSNCSNVFGVEINKGSYKNVTHPEIKGTYDANKKLSAYTLQEGFKWKNLTVANEVPVVNKKEYEALYCLDYDNYHEYSLKIIVDLEKAPSPVGSHVLLSQGDVYSPNKTLRDYPLSGVEWRWANLDVVPQAGDHQYDACYNPDIENYLDYETKVRLILNKAVYENVSNLNLEIEYESDLTLLKVVENHSKEMGDYTLAPSVSRAIRLSEIKTYEFDGIYNADDDNYEDYDCKVIIKVIKSRPSVNYNEENVIDGGIYKPNQTLSNITLNEGWRWKNAGEELLSGENEYVIIYNPNENYYVDYELTITLKVEKGTLTYAEHESLTGTYSRTQTLGGFMLDEGWSWVDSSETPTVSKTKYQAIFVQSVHYYPYSTEIALVLNKANISLDSIKFEDKTVTYDGEGHSITYSGEVPDGLSFKNYLHTAPIKNAGTYECKAYFTQTDKVNYNIANKTILTAILRINKATIDVSGVIFNGKEITYDGNAHYLECEGTLPSGVTIEYFGNGQVNAGRHVVELKFNLLDDQNYSPSEPKIAVLTIKKATSNIVANEKYYYAYDGEEHVPSLSVDNTEQIVLYEKTGEIKEIGEYTLKFYAPESANYTRVEKTVNIVINKNSIQCGNVYNGEITALIGKVTNMETGIDSDATLTMNVSLINNEEVVFDILLGGEALEGNYTVNILLPEGIFGSPKVYLQNGEEYVEIESITNGNYVIFNTQKLGTYKLVATEEWNLAKEKELEWWGWLLISISIVIVIGGVAILVIAIKKGKIPLDKVMEKVKTVFKKNNEKKETVEDTLTEGDGEQYEE